MLASNYAVCGKKKSRFIKNQELNEVVFNICIVLIKFKND